MNTDGPSLVNPPVQMLRFDLKKVPFPVHVQRDCLREHGCVTLCTRTDTCAHPGGAASVLLNAQGGALRECNRESYVCMCTHTVQVSRLFALFPLPHPLSLGEGAF